LQQCTDMKGGSSGCCDLLSFFEQLIFATIYHDSKC
jgi:hypothetical protein